MEFEAGVSCAKSDEKEKQYDFKKIHFPLDGRTVHIIKFACYCVLNDS
jgi:hypothetical protein